MKFFCTFGLAISDERNELGKDAKIDGLKCGRITTSDILGDINITIHAITENLLSEAFKSFNDRGRGSGAVFDGPIVEGAIRCLTTCKFGLGWFVVLKKIIYLFVGLVLDISELITSEIMGTVPITSSVIMTTPSR